MINGVRRYPRLSVVVWPNKILFFREPRKFHAHRRCLAGTRGGDTGLHRVSWFCRPRTLQCRALRPVGSVETYLNIFVSRRTISYDLSFLDIIDMMKMYLNNYLKQKTCSSNKMFQNKNCLDNYDILIGLLTYLLIQTHFVLYY